MATNDNFINRIRCFFGLHPQPPRNDFRNPIWGSDDDDDDEDELYSRQQMDARSPADLHQELTRHVHDMMRSFGGIFGDMKSFFNDDFNSLFENDNFNYQYAGPVPELPIDSDKSSNKSIRDYYLKPGYHSRTFEQKDIDLDGKISSQELSGLFKRKEQGNEISPVMVEPFVGAKVPARSFCQTIITTSIKKPDGTVETRRTVKKGNEVIEETTTSSGPDNLSPVNPGLGAVSTTGIMLSELTSLFKNLY